MEDNPACPAPWQSQKGSSEGVSVFHQEAASIEDRAILPQARKPRHPDE
jgi:hypothetical protein